jgi:tripartite-type tricarboxylate transporter receptor subunit TctC
LWHEASTRLGQRRKEVDVKVRSSRQCRVAAASAVLAVAAAGVQAQAWPAKPVRYIIPQSAGGQVDTVGRTVAQNLSERLGQPLIVDNRAGANGAIGFEAGAKAAPDGYTLLMSNQSGLVFAPIVKKSLPYDPLADFTPITQLFETPYYLLVHPSVPARSVQELVALVRAQPGKLNYGTVGVGSGQHLFIEVLKAATGIDIVHVPYKGAAQFGTDLLAGSVQIGFQFYGFSVPNARSGKTRALASTGSKRTEAMPDLPTMIEAGVPGYTAATWYALSAPARLPAPILQRLNRETTEVLRSAAMREKFAPQDVVLLPGSPDELTNRIKTETPLFTKIARNAGIEPD